MRQINWSRQAIRDMTRIGRHIAADGPANAGKLLDQIEAKAMALASYPQIGRISGNSEGSWWFMRTISSSIASCRTA